MPDFSGNSFAEASFALDAALRSDPEIPLGPGSTGDSRLLVLHADGSFTRMSSDQKPNDPKETKRVKRAGGSVLRTAMGVWRIDGRLALSRSFGDFVSSSSSSSSSSGSSGSSSSGSRSSSSTGVAVAAAAESPQPQLRRLRKQQQLQQQQQQ
ncbi:hypothetical protein ENH_00041640 [Eimeria necatrix]|uniref:PPM-type phosphatase domain-containing protein n=1 Tax=Eimeria necatrix TaxID=51315 RepID=U6MUX0_9EIME|nr:hypothetical protein ENH_00041640 [Eimeria necatrix]CDJ67791.1 hypothetical protein ENH_00041640 [Eimeria necatrix]